MDTLILEKEELPRRGRSGEQLLRCPASRDCPGGIAQIPRVGEGDETAEQKGEKNLFHFRKTRARFRPGCDTVMEVMETEEKPLLWTSPGAPQEV